VSLDNPCSDIVVSLELPCSLLGASLEYPWRILGGLLEHPCSFPGVSLERSWIITLRSPSTLIESRREITTNLESGGRVYLTNQTKAGKARRKCNSAILECRVARTTATIDW